MKKILLTVSMAAFFTPSFSQYQKNYNRSVYQDYSKMAANPEFAAANREKISVLLPEWSATFDKLSGSVNRLYGPGLVLAGNTAQQKAQTFINTKLSELGINPTEWKIARTKDESFASFADFKRYINGKEVIESRLAFHFSQDGKLVSVRIKDHGDEGINQVPTLTRDAILSSRSMTEGLEDGTYKQKNLAADWVWFPVPNAAGYELRPAYEFDFIASEKGNVPAKLVGYVDAINGNLLYRDNRLKDVVDVTVKGDVHKTSIALPVTQEPLANLKVELNSTVFFTDANGKVNTTDANVDMLVHLEGKWAKVNDDVWGWTPAFSVLGMSTGSYNFAVPDVTAPNSDKKHVNGYYHTNKVHDHMKKYLPTFTGLDFPIDVNIDVDWNGNTCNAFWNGNSLNFLPSSSNCPSFAQFSDVVYHEYGHGIGDIFYQDHGGSWGIRNGAMHEGNADVWAMSILEEALIGRNAFGAGTVMRRYDLKPKISPGDLIGEVHADGEIIAGTWYDVAIAMNSFDKMTQLFSKTYFDLPDGANGTEEEVFRDILLSALINDDNDANIKNGTPNGSLIQDVFARHGIRLFDAVITHAELDNQPGSAPVTVSATVVSGTLGNRGDVKLVYRNRQSGNNWTEVLMAGQSNNLFTAQIPPQQPGSVVEYYIAAYAASGSVPAATMPAYIDHKAPVSSETNIPYQFAIGMGATKITNFETPEPDWTIGNVTGDDATSGIWIQETPRQSTFVNRGRRTVVQTGADHTTGTGKCLVTANASSTTADLNLADVDMGATSVLTPVIDLSTYSMPMIGYHRWFSNNKGGNPASDAWVVLIRDADQPTADWVKVEEAKISDHSWRRRIFDVAALLPGAKKVQLKFTASDNETTAFAKGQSTVEAALDDFIIYDMGTLSVANSSTAAANISVYPSPANHMVTVELPSAQNGTVELYDISGKIIEVQTMVAQQTKYTFATAQLVPGTYMIKVQSGSSSQVQKLVVKH